MPQPRNLNRAIVVVVLGLLLLWLAKATAEAQPEPPPEQGPAQAFMTKLRHQLALPETKVKAADEIQEVAYALRSVASYMGHHLQRGEPNPIARQKMLRAIAAIGATAKDALPGVLKSLDDPDDDVRIAAIGAVGGMAPVSKAAIPKLSKFVQHKNPVVRRRAIGALTMMGPESRSAVPVLIAALNDPDEGSPGKEAKVAFYAVQALAAIGADAKIAGEALLELQKATRPELRAPALEALAKIVPDEPKLVPILIECVKNDNHARVRLSATQALGRLGPKAKDAVPTLIDALRAPYTGHQFDEPIKIAAAWALGQIGPEARAALPVLRELSSHMNPAIRDEAKRAIEKIGTSK